MKKSTFFPAIILSAALFSSCGKNNPSVNNINKVKTYTENFTSSSGNLSATFNLGYDSNDRITSITSASSPGDKFLFNYISNDQYTMDLYSGGSVSIHEDFFLKNSLIDSTFQYNDTQDSSSEKYFYNSSNQLIKMNEYEYYNGPELSNTTTYTYDSNGNLAKTSDSDNNVETFDYYPDLLNVIPLSTPFMRFTGKANLIKTDTVTLNGSLVSTTSSTYTFDSYNRISTITETSTDGTSVVKTYTYF